MSLQNLCAKRELFFTQYADIEKSIQTLRELCKDNNEKLVLIESFDKYMRQKYEIFADLQDIENKRQKIDELDRLKDNKGHKENRNAHMHYFPLITFISIAALSNKLVLLLLVALVSLTLHCPALSSYSCLWVNSIFICCASCNVFSYSLIAF
ncbi:MAG: hypothetical protein SPJ83_01660 [Helicobacter sp.]|uniref:hypothetical protein n=1 Tax=Helicobacter sp. TaxID=218 RepID=UPI002A90DF43|nr:hypothetical protein [Helicobacter sp.]MDY5821494.1 hypothetical protein [Helicobacter sp.]